MKKILFSVLFLFCAAAFAGTALEDDEVIEFYPSAAIIGDDGILTAEIRGRVLEKQDTARRETLKKEINTALGVSPDFEKDALFKTRVKSFFADGESGRIIQVNFLNKVFTMKKSSFGGFFTGTVHAAVPDTQIASAKNKPLFFTAVPEKKDTRIFKGTVIAVTEYGVSVISDIDDTVKISNVADKNELLKNSFFREYKAVPGMALVYSTWAAGGAVFHYVSGSPRQMYGLLADFFAVSGFPAGEFRLKPADLFDGSLSSFVNADQFAYKTGEIRAVMDRFPHRTFILVGDSGEKDPEVYAGIASEYPERIAAVCIRDVSAPDITKKRIALLNKKNMRWVIFKEGKDLEREHIL